MLRKIIDKFGLDHVMLKTVSKITAGNIASKGFASIFWFIIVWLVSVEEYGSIRYAFTVASFLSLPVVSGFGAAITKFISEHRNEDTVSTYAFHTILMDTIVLIFILLSIPVLHLLFRENIPFTSMFFVFILALYNLYYATVRGIMDIRRMIWFGIMVNFFRVVFVICFYLLSIRGIVPSLVAYGVPIFIGPIVLIFIRKKKIKILSEKLDKQIIRKILRFSVPGFMGAFSFMFISQINIIIVKLYLTIEDVAYYSLAFTIAALIGFISQGIIAIQVPVISGFKGNKKKIFLYVCKSIRLGLLGLLTLAFLMYISAPLLFEYIFPPHYAQSLGILYILIPGAIFVGLLSIIGAVWTGYGKPEESLKIMAFGIPLILLFNVILLPEFGLDGSALSYTLTEAIIFFGLYYKTMKYFRSN